jgi:hypothetical protein
MIMEEGNYVWLLAANAHNVDGWRQVAELGLALLFSALVGLEREIRQKSAGLRTYTLVGVGAALFMLISKYGFSDLLEPGRIVLDPLRSSAESASSVQGLSSCDAIRCTESRRQRRSGSRPPSAPVPVPAFLFLRSSPQLFIS